MLIVAAVILLTALGTTTTILLNRLPAATAPAVPAAHQMVFAGELQRPYPAGCWMTPSGNARSASATRGCWNGCGGVSA